MKWPLIQIGDKVNVTRLGFINLGYDAPRDSDFWDYLTNLEFNVIGVESDNDCSENNHLCSCDKFITVQHKGTGIVLKSLVLDEIIIRELV